MVKESYMCKAKRKDNSEWIAGWLILEPYGYAIQHYKDGKRTKTVIDESTICRCLGFQDNNEKWIFENDKLEVGYSSPDGEPHFSTCIAKEITDYEFMMFLDHSDSIEILE